VSCREAEEEANDVRKVGHMGNFYANLLTKNVAMGTATAAPKPKGGDTAPPAEPEDREEKLAAAAAAALQQKKQQKGPALDKYEQTRLEAELALRQQKVRPCANPSLGLLRFCIDWSSPPIHSMAALNSLCVRFVGHWAPHCTSLPV